MKTIFAQAATFALSAVGALAILVGVIDQPKVVANVTGSPTGPLVAAVMSPAVSPLT
jgi:predicted RNase H-like nuclease